MKSEYWRLLKMAFWKNSCWGKAFWKLHMWVYICTKKTDLRLRTCSCILAYRYPMNVEQDGDNWLFIYCMDCAWNGVDDWALQMLAGVQSKGSHPLVLMEFYNRQLDRGGVRSWLYLLGLKTNLVPCYTHSKGSTWGGWMNHQKAWLGHRDRCLHSTSFWQSDGFL